VAESSCPALGPSGLSARPAAFAALRHAAQAGLHGEGVRVGPVGGSRLGGAGITGRAARINRKPRTAWNEAEMHRGDREDNGGVTDAGG